MSKKKVVAFCGLYPSLTTRNFLFENEDAGIGDDLLKQYNQLKLEAEKRGLVLCTADVCPLDQIDAFVFLEVPSLDNEYYRHVLDTKKASYLVVSEIGLLHKDNFDIFRLDFFNKIFTYYDPLVDNKKYYKTNYSFSLPRTISNLSSDREGFCTLIAGNKTAEHPLELYSARLKVIRWFEENHPDKFDLYGIGWDREVYSKALPLAFKVLKKIGWLSKKTENKLSVPRKLFPSSRGPVKRKSEVLARYRFCICFENFKDVPGWITEKIFDCFFAGCVPIYWGANNVADHIPQSCFIDYRNFSSVEELYGFLVAMEDTVYMRYLSDIQDFLNSSQAHEFSIDYFCNTVLDVAVDDLG